MRDVYRPANAVLVAGDIHAAYATDFGADADGNRVVEITTLGISSAPFRELLRNTGNAVPAIRDRGLVDPVLDVLDFLLTTATPKLVHARSDVNGVTVISIDRDELTADFHVLPGETTAERFYEAPADLSSRWEVARYRVRKEAGKNGPLTSVS